MSVATLSVIVAAVGGFSCGNTETVGAGFDGSDDGAGGRFPAGDLTGDAGGFDLGAGQPSVGPQEPAQRSPDPPRTPLENLEPPEGYVLCFGPGISRDGSTVAATCQSAGRESATAAVWRLDAPPVPPVLIDLGESEPTGARLLNRDGSVVIASKGGGVLLWKSGNVIAIPDVSPLALSSDGSRIVGGCHIETEADIGLLGAEHYQACTWTESEGTRLLPVSSPDDDSTAIAVSADGRVIVGRSVTQEGRMRALRWVDGGSSELLPIPSDAGSASAECISADGAVIGGIFRSADGERAVRWSGDEVELLPSTLQIHLGGIG